MKLTGKKLLLVGGNGFVGRSCAKLALLRGAEVHSLSRSGSPPKNLQEPWMNDINWHKGSALDARSYHDLVQDVDGLIFAVAVLFDSTFPGRGGSAGDPGSYEQMNRETLITVAREANESKKCQNLVYLSAHCDLPFFPRYLSTKLEAEAFLKEQTNLNHTILRPGVIYTPTTTSGMLYGQMMNYVEWQNQLASKLVGLVSKKTGACMRKKMCPGRGASVVDIARISVTAAGSDELNNTTVANDDIPILGDKYRVQFERVCYSIYELFRKSQFV